MSRKIAFLFPGQGSQFVGMAADLVGEYASVARTLQEANETLGWDLSQVMAEGPQAELTATEVAQPALLAHGVAIYRLLQEQGCAPTMVAGHSLGEYTALVAAGALEFSTALLLVRKRGEAMAAAGVDAGGAMAAVLGMEDEEVEDCVEQAAQEGIVVVANYNSPGQVVISGESAAVLRAGELAKAAGARAVMPLKVSGAFHSPLMAPAAELMEPVLSAASLDPAAVPVVSNVDATPRQETTALREALVAQITGAVRWTESVQRMRAAGVEVFVEVGPGDVLTKLMKRIDRDATALSTSTAEGYRNTLEELGC